MKILVAVKRVVDYRVNIRINLDGSNIETHNVLMSMNPFDEIAVEAAVCLKEQHLAQEVLVVSVGSNQAEDVLRTALAMGADRALLFETEEQYEPLNIAKILAFVCQQEQPHLVLLGKQAIDDDCNQTGQMLAGLLNWSQGTFISKLELNNEQVVVTREVDQGLETLQLNLPAVLTADLRLNQPRYISLPNIMKAKQKILDKMNVTALNLECSPHQEVLRIEPPTERKPGIKVNCLDELINKLKIDEKVWL